MANDHQASYGKIGFTVFIGVIATVLTLIYLGGIGNQKDEIKVETSYDQSVSGLAVGSPVNFRGVKVGRVSAISFVGSVYAEVNAEMESGRIYIEMALDKTLLGDPEGSMDEFREGFEEMVGKGIRASVTSNGITGMTRIELDFYPNDPPAPEISWHPRNIYIPPHLSLLDSFSVAATKAVNNLNKMDFSSTWSNVAHSVESISRASLSLQVMMESRQDDLEKIAASVTEAVSDIRDTAAQLRRNPSLLVRELKPEELEETR